MRWIRNGKSVRQASDFTWVVKIATLCFLCLHWAEQNHRECLRSLPWNGFLLFPGGIYGVAFEKSLTEKCFPFARKMYPLMVRPLKPESALKIRPAIFCRPPEWSPDMPRHKAKAFGWTAALWREAWSASITTPFCPKIRHNHWVTYSEGSLIHVKIGCLMRPDFATD